MVCTYHSISLQNTLITVTRSINESTVVKNLFLPFNNIAKGQTMCCKLSTTISFVTLFPKTKFY